LTTKSARVAGPRHRVVDDRFPGAEAAMLQRRQEIVRELQPDGDLGVDQDASIEISSAVGASRAACMPALLRRTLEPSALRGSASGEHENSGQRDAQYAGSIDCILGEQNLDHPVWRHIGELKVILIVLASGERRKPGRRRLTR
jgi:hypothetical protein